MFFKQGIESHIKAWHADQFILVINRSDGTDHPAATGWINIGFRDPDAFFGGIVFGVGEEVEIEGGDVESSGKVCDGVEAGINAVQAVAVVVVALDNEGMAFMEGFEYFIKGFGDIRDFLDGFRDGSGTGNPESGSFIAGGLVKNAVGSEGVILGAGGCEEFFLAFVERVNEGGEIFGFFAECVQIFIKTECDFFREIGLHPEGGFPTAPRRPAKRQCAHKE